MASDQQAVSKSMKHPGLGPSDAIYDDHSKTRGGLFLALFLTCLGPIGILMGLGDFSDGGFVALGVFYVGSGVILGLYGLWHAYLAVMRLRSQFALIVGRDGFEVPSGDGPVGWDEVDTVSDPSAPPGAPETVRVQLADPGDYAARHSLGLVNRYLLRARKGDLVLGRDMSMPVADVQGLMRQRLAEFGRLRHDGSKDDAGPAGRPSGQPREPARKRH